MTTDHKALENIKSKPVLSGNLINRQKEMMQEFYFKIGYQEPENLKRLDALLRMQRDGVKSARTKQSKVLEALTKNMC